MSARRPKGLLELKEPNNSYASGTPATDGQQVYVSLLKTDGTQVPIPGAPDEFMSPDHAMLMAYDMNGERKWEAQAGRFVYGNGYCCAPVFFKDKVIINVDHDGTGYLVALDHKSGQVTWKVDRDNKVSLGNSLLR